MGNKVINTTSVKLQIYETSTDSQLAGMLGDVKEFEDGKKFRLCRNDATAALEPAKLIQAKAYSANNCTLTIPTTVAAGATTLSVTVKANVAVNELKDGYFYVETDSTDGEEGHGRKIKANTVATTGNNTTLTFYDALTDSITAGTSKGAWVFPIYKDVLKDAGGAKVIGVTVCDVPVSVTATSVYYYFWAQVAGPCPVYTTGISVGLQVVADGSGGVLDDTGSLTAAHIGVAMNTIATTNVGLINLNLE